MSDLPTIPSPPLDLSEFRGVPDADKQVALRKLVHLYLNTPDGFDQLTIEGVAQAEFNITKTKFEGLVKAERRSLKRLGASKAEEESNQRVAKAIKGMYYDSQRNYYRQLDDNAWDAMSVEQARRHLKVEHGLTDDIEQGQNVSELEVALHTIETHQRVLGALPFPLIPEAVTYWEGKKYLNISSAVLLQPAKGSTTGWGDGFPRVGRFLEVLFPDQKNLDIVMAWLRVWYKRCLVDGRGGKGQALFIVGPVKTGKTFFSNCILGRIFGGVANAASYFTEGNSFNASLFDHVVWALDDSTILGDKSAHQKFSGLVKATAANPSFSYDKKYGYRGSVPFRGRFVCTLNDGPASIEILPDTDQDLLDKVILVKTGSAKAVVPGVESENFKMLDEELPFFLRWLSQTNHAEWVTTDDDRAGIDAFHDKWVLGEARSTSTSSYVGELLETWRSKVEPAAVTDSEQGFIKQPDGGYVWEGTASDLVFQLSKCANTQVLLTPHLRTSKILSRHINTIIENGAKFVYRKSKGQKGKPTDKEREEGNRKDGKSEKNALIGIEMIRR